MNKNYNNYLGKLNAVFNSFELEWKNELEKNKNHYEKTIKALEEEKRILLNKIQTLNCDKDELNDQINSLDLELRAKYCWSLMIVLCILGLVLLAFFWIIKGFWFSLLGLLPSIIILTFFFWVTERVEEWLYKIYDFIDKFN
jgi:hypothetical protein